VEVVQLPALSHGRAACCGNRIALDSEPAARIENAWRIVTVKDIGSRRPTLAAKTRTRRGWGTQTDFPHERVLSVLTQKHPGNRGTYQVSHRPG
jgi:hypothetical protein